MVLILIVSEQPPTILLQQCPPTTYNYNNCDDELSQPYCQRLYINKQNNATDNSSNYYQNNEDDVCIRHITRVNISDVCSQVDVYQDADPVTKEGMYTCAFSPIDSIQFPRKRMMLLYFSSRVLLHDKTFRFL